MVWRDNTATFAVVNGNDFTHETAMGQIFARMP